MEPIRRKTHSISVGSIEIGSLAPISIQTMMKIPLLPQNQDRILSELKKYRKLGCHIVRFAVPNVEAIEPLKFFCQAHILPIVADIHFDYKLALASIEAGVQKIRINPGNIGAAWKVVEVLKAAKDAHIPIRVGINGGSLPSTLRHLPRVEAMVEAAFSEAEIFEKEGFREVLFSLKSSNTEETIEANRIFAKKTSYPLHLGVTEAGPLLPALVKSSVALSTLLKEGIGDTVRISVSDDPTIEIKAAREILKACGYQIKGVNIVSCPKCGRAVFDEDNGLIQEIEDFLYTVDKDISVAIMGCPVNGPGEAKEADLGVTGTGSSVLLFRKGKVLKTVEKNQLLKILKEEIDKI